MPQRTCAIGDCPNTRKRAGGRCETHYRHAVAAGEIELPVKLCALDGCDEREFCGVLCSKHYTRLQRWGTTDDPEPAPETCELPDCDEPYHASGRCLRHYRLDYDRARRAKARATREAAGPETLFCEDCGDEFSRRVLRGPKARRCEECTQAAWDEAKRAHAERVAPPLVIEYECRYCGCLFCSTVPDGRPRSICAGCRSLAAVESTTRWQRAHPEQVATYKATSQQRRRALVWDPDADFIERNVVFDRDGWCCHLCQDAIDRNLAYPDPWSASLDHVIPLSRGGTHTYDNVAASHWLCNIRRGARLLVM